MQAREDHASTDYLSLGDGDRGLTESRAQHVPREQILVFTIS